METELPDTIALDGPHAALAMVFAGLVRRVTAIPGRLIADVSAQFPPQPPAELEAALIERVEAAIR
jgi:hypothetical protein